jgi:sugar phosphate isomerase/epimerase
MKIGLMCGVFSRHEEAGRVSTTRDYLTTARSYGFETYLMSTNRELPGIDDEESVREARKLLGDLGMTASLSSGGLGKRLGNDEGSIRTVFEAAKSLEAHCVCTTFMVPMRSRWKDHWTSEQSAEFVKRDTDAVAALAEFACEYEMPLAFENHLDYTFDEFCAILDAVDDPWVGVNFDTANPLLFVEDPMAYARKFRDRILTFHMKDGVTVPKPDGAALTFTALGDGLVDLEAIVRTINWNLREIPVNLEYWTQAEEPIAFEQPEFWADMGKTPEDGGETLELLKRDAAKGRPAPQKDPEKGLQDEVRVLKATPPYLAALFGR